jgi:hypothetical protein
MANDEVPMMSSGKLDVPALKERFRVEYRLTMTPRS